MCTVILLRRPGDAWPLLLAANRDEQLDRAWDAPAAHWPDQPGIVAGRDRTGGGSWMGVNRSGVVAAVLNRPGSLGPAAGKRSRGEIPLLALAHADARQAASAVAALDAGRYRTFNCVIADRDAAFFLRGLGSGRPELAALPPGLHMVTAHDPDDLASPRIARHLPRLRAAPVPVPAQKPENGDWAGWQEILADRSPPAGSEMNVPPRDGFGTSCASLLALPASGPPQWLFAPGPPDQTAYTSVALG